MGSIDDLMIGLGALSASSGSLHGHLFIMGLLVANALPAMLWLGARPTRGNRAYQNLNL